MTIGLVKANNYNGAGDVLHVHIFFILRKLFNLGILEDADFIRITTHAKPGYIFFSPMANS
jgi:hypothetical protein